MIADMLSNKNLTPIVMELFIRGRKLNIYLVFITYYYYFAVPKNIRLNSTHYFFMKIRNKRELQQIAFNHSSVIYFKDLMNLHKKQTACEFCEISKNTYFTEHLRTTASVQESNS